MASKALRQFDDDVMACRACPRLVEWREKVATEKRASFATWTYWGKPVPSFGAGDARVLILGLAPAAHGANRTGRMFTGDESGRWLFRALHRAGFANQAESTRRDDGLALDDCRITATAHCAPPDNKPLPDETRNCARFLSREMDLLSSTKVVIALGKIAWDAYLAWARDERKIAIRPKPAFSHLAIVKSGLPHALVGSYHPSQQNTFTGKLTEKMFDDVFTHAKKFL